MTGWMILYLAFMVGCFGVSAWCIWETWKLRNYPTIRQLLAWRHLTDTELLAAYREAKEAWHQAYRRRQDLADDVQHGRRFDRNAVRASRVVSDLRWREYQQLERYVQRRFGVKF